MTYDRRISIARKIILDGTQAERARLESTIMADMAPADREAIENMIGRLLLTVRWQDCYDLDPRRNLPA